MIAVIIPFFKLKYFEATLQSLADQTDKRFKVYIGNDASPENPERLIETYKNILDIEYVRFNENLGAVSLVKQWERCIAMVKEEEWYLILGDDDILGPNVIKEWYKHYNDFSEKTEVVRFASKMIMEKTNTITETYIHPIWEEAPASFLRKYKNITRSSLSEYAFSAKTYKKYGFFSFPLAWNSDDRAWLDFSDSKPIYTINDAIVYFRLSELNISGRSDNLKKKTESSIIFYKYLIEEKLFFYQKKDRLNFLRMYEQETGKFRKTKTREWLFLAFYYSRDFDFYNFKKFVKRWVKSFLK